MSKQPKCPKCGSENIAGLVQAFWVSIINGEPVEGWEKNIGSETEIGPERLCSNCAHEFIGE